MNRSRRKPGHACIAELDLLTLFSPAAQFTPIPCCRINIVSKTVFDYLVPFEVFPPRHRHMRQRLGYRHLRFRIPCIQICHSSFPHLIVAQRRYQICSG